MPINSKHAYGGLGFPNIDRYNPFPSEIYNAILGLARDNGDYFGSDISNEDLLSYAKSELAGNQEAELLVSSLEHLDKIEAFVKKRDVNSKYTLKDEDDLAEIHGYYTDFENVAHIINRYCDEDNQVEVITGGGTMANKLNVLQHLTGTQTILFGAFASNSRSFFSALGGMRMIPGDSSLENTKQSFVFLDEKSRNRVILKAPDPNLRKAVEPFKSDIKAEIAKLDTFMLEASEASDGKFGMELVTEFVHHAMKLDKEIIFSPPTNMNLIMPSDNSKEELERVRNNREFFMEVTDYKGTSVLTMNETEAVMMYGDVPLEPGFVLEDIDPESPMLHRAMGNIQEILAAKKSLLSPNDVEPVAFVTASVHGAFIITAQGRHFEKAKEIPNIVDSTGAGDSFAGGAIAERHILVHRKGITEFSDTDLVSQLRAGKNMSEVIIMQRGTQADRDSVRSQLEHDTPTHAEKVERSRLAVGGNPHQR